MPRSRSPRGGTPYSNTFRMLGTVTREHLPILSRSRTPKLSSSKSSEFLMSSAANARALLTAAAPGNRRARSSSTAAAADGVSAGVRGASWSSILRSGCGGLVSSDRSVQKFSPVQPVEIPWRTHGRCLRTSRLTSPRLRRYGHSERTIQPYTCFFRTLVYITIVIVLT
jgi:hypothetical protein